MKISVRLLAAALLLCMLSAFVLAGCDLSRKLEVEVQFQKKVEEAKELSFDVELQIRDESGESAIQVRCAQKGEDYAYTFVSPEATSTHYRRLYADGKLYEFMNSSSLPIGSYYIEENTLVSADENLLYWVKRNIMAATYALFLVSGTKEDLDGTEVYHYSFSIENNDYHLWYDSKNLVRIQATFRDTDESGAAHEETYTASFTNYRFGDADEAFFKRPEDLKGSGLYAESPISFEDWMKVLDRFSSRAANWMK